MNRVRKKLQPLGLCLAVLVMAVPAAAQDTPKAEVSAGYQLLGFSDETLPMGWYVDVAGNLSPLFGIVFEVGGNYKSVNQSVTIFGVTNTVTADLSVHEFME